MTKAIQKGFTHYSPWFDVEKDGLPLRTGVYEGKGSGNFFERYKTDGGGYNSDITYRDCQYFHWNGRDWDTCGDSPEKMTGTVVGKPGSWRGVIPNKHYPFDQVKSNEIENGARTLTREGVSDTIIIDRFLQTDKTLELIFVRQFGSRDPEEYRCTLNRIGSEYEGSAKANIRGFVVEKATPIRVNSIVKTQDGIEVWMTLQGVQALVFKGVLKGAEFVSS